MYFNDQNGNLYEGEPYVRGSMYQEYRQQNPDKEIEVRNCSTDKTEKKKLRDLVDHGIWRNVGWVAAIIGLIVLVLQIF